MRAPQPYGGPGSFQKQLEVQFLSEGYNILHYKNFKFRRVSSIIVFSSTKHLLFLIYQFLLGSDIILRLDGLNKKHRFKKVSVFYYVYSELDNMVSCLIARYVASTIIFQSEYIMNNWKSNGFDFHGKNVKVILNGVDTNRFYPMNKLRHPDKICVVEGAIDDLVAVSVLNNLLIECHVYGKVDSLFKEKVTNDLVKFHGLIPRDRIAEVLNEYRVFLLLEVNPPCPNALIEAMACGLIPVAYLSGAVNEIVTCKSRFLIEYGSDPEKYEIPQMESLNSVIYKALDSFDEFSDVYRNLVLKRMCINEVAKQYLRSMKDSVC